MSRRSSTPPLTRGRSMATKAGGGSTPIEALLQREAQVSAAQGVRQARQRQPRLDLRAGRQEPGQVLGGGGASELDWFKPWEKVLEWEAPEARWFVGGEINATYNCLDRHVEAGGRKTRPPSSGRASRATPGRSPTRTSTGRCAASPTSLNGRGPGGRPGHDLHADDPGAGDRHAGLHRMGATHSVIFGGFALSHPRPHQRCQGDAHYHGRRWLAAR